MSVSQDGAGADSQRTLSDLVSDVHTARAGVHLSRMNPVVRADLVLAHHVLLDALEAYASGLAGRHLPIPPRLRDELRLQRRIGHQSTWTGTS